MYTCQQGLDLQQAPQACNLGMSPPISLYTYQRWVQIFPSGCTTNHERLSRQHRGKLNLLQFFINILKIFLQEYGQIPSLLTVEGFFSCDHSVIVIIFQFLSTKRVTFRHNVRVCSRELSADQYERSLFTWFLNSIDVAPKNRSNNCQDMIICRCSSSCNNLFGWRRHSKSLGMSSHGE